MKINWDDVDKFAYGAGLSQTKAHELNSDPLIQKKRKEYAPEFDLYEEELNTILYSQVPGPVTEALPNVPNNVLMAFFGILGPTVVETKVKITGGTRA